VILVITCLRTVVIRCFDPAPLYAGCLGQQNLQQQCQLPPQVGLKLRRLHPLVE
jgi:hypothetical protein